MTEALRVLKIDDVPPRTTSAYPPQFAQRVAGRSKRALGDKFGIGHFGVNHVTLAPGAQSSIRHHHTVQDEFVIVLSGELSLVDDHGEITLTTGMCAGFRHGGNAHHLINRTETEAAYLEIGDRLPDDSATYPDDDLLAVPVGGGWRYFHRNGKPYDE